MQFIIGTVIDGYLYIVFSALKCLFLSFTYFNAITIYTFNVKIHVPSSAVVVNFFAPLPLQAAGQLALAALPFT